MHYITAMLGYIKLPTAQCNTTEDQKHQHQCGGTFKSCSS